VRILGILAFFGAISVGVFSSVPLEKTVWIGMWIGIGVSFLSAALGGVACHLGPSYYRNSSEGKQHRKVCSEARLRLGPASVTQEDPAASGFNDDPDLKTAEGHEDPY